MARVDISLKKKYYTDWHDVDEETTTISAYGGHWNEDRTGAGITQRYLAIPWTTGELVASK